jgi:hypothetical protein
VFLRKFAFLVAMTWAAVLPFCWCQPPSSKPAISQILARLQSKEWTERSSGIERIYDQPDVLDSAKLRLVLLNLLDRENLKPDKNAHDTQMNKTSNTNASRAEEGADEEAFAWYLTAIQSIVGSFVNWTEPRQACIMVNSGWVDYRTSPQEAALRAKAAMPCIFKMAEDGRTAYRDVAIPMLVEALAKGNTALDSTTVRKAKHIIMGDLHDSDVGIRIGTIIALGDYGEADVIPALQEIARTDPAFEKTSDAGDNRFLVRDAAVKAITRIQGRAEQR